MTVAAERWRFGYRLSLAPRQVAELATRRTQLVEDLIGYRLGRSDGAPLFVPALGAVFVVELGGGQLLRQIRHRALRVDRPESVGRGTQSGDCVPPDPGPRVLAPQALGLNPDRPAGTGVRVAVLDSGIDLGHPDFGGDRIAGSIALVGSGSIEDRSPDSHGTASAGIIAGPRRPFDGGCRYGVAADARLLIAKVIEDNGRSNSFAVELACAWALAEGADIISLSLGFDRARDAPPSVLSRSLSRLSRRYRTLMVAAAGNGDWQQDGIKNPAAGTRVLAIGALDLAGRVRHDSLRGDARAEVFCVAPGANVVCPRREADPQRPVGARHFFNGTSAAAPVVAGLAAVLRSEQPGCCADMLAAELIRRCRMPPAADALAYGHGVLTA
ncbi:MAG: S8 family serine peptidase [Lysobacterales bacterium]